MLIRPMPFPEELDRGYLGRVIRMNGCSKKKDGVALINSWAGTSDKSGRELSRIKLLAMVAGMELPVFATQHTTLPLRRGITSYQPDLPHGCESNRSMLWTSGMRTARTGAYFCANCAREDLNFHGQSYWRREHQIPGLLWCPKHSTSLWYMDDEAAFLLPPMSLINSAHSVDAEWAEEMAGNETVQRYVQICSSLMVRTSPLAVKAVRGVLQARASSLGFQTHSRSVNGPLLSDEVIRRCGRTWLATVLPALADKPEGILLNQLDGVLYLATSASGTGAYALACAVLFDSADAAINALTNPMTISSEGRRRRKITLSQEELIDAYVQSLGNHAKVASLLGVSVPTVATRLKKAGLPHLAQKNMLKLAVAFYLEKRSLPESMALAGISQEALDTLIRTTGGPFLAALKEMKRPAGGRGSGVRRPLQLTPEEARSAQGQKAFKYSPRLRREQRQALQTDAIEDQKVLQ